MKSIGIVVYAIGGIWALGVLLVGGGGAEFVAFFIAAAFGIIGTIFYVAGAKEKTNLQSNSKIAEVERIKKLLDDKVITQEEFEQMKKEILGNN